MAIVFIMKSDTVVKLDGDRVDGVDMSGLPNDFHALHWNGSTGQIEHSQRNPETGEIDYSMTVKPNDFISSVFRSIP